MDSRFFVFSPSPSLSALMVSNPIYLPELREMLADNNIEEMQEFCTAIHPVRVAEFMEGLKPNEIWTILQSTDLENRVEIFNYLDEETQADIIEAAPREEIAHFIAHLPSDDRVDALQAVEGQVVGELLSLLHVEDRRDIQRLTAFPEDSCGSEMTTDFVRLHENMTVSEALDEISRQTAVIETVYYLYVVDENDHLVGLVSAKQLLKNISRPEILIKTLMKRDLITVDAMESRENAAREVARYDFLAIPVVDEERHMLGIITHDDIIDVLEEETTEDVYRMAAIAPMEEKYLEAPFWTIWKSRVVWLSLLCIAGLGTFSALAYFEDEIRELYVLTLFVPLILSVGGNSGSQSATLITRAMALGGVKISDFFRIFRHELLMGLALGLSLGFIGFFRALSTPGSLLDGVSRLQFSLTICFAVAASCLTGTLVGALLPLLFKRLGIDPGVASGPFVATFVDVVGIVMFFTIAKILIL